MDTLFFSLAVCALWSQVISASANPQRAALYLRCKRGDGIFQVYTTVFFIHSSVAAHYILNQINVYSDSFVKYKLSTVNFSFSNNMSPDD